MINLDIDAIIKKGEGSQIDFKEMLPRYDKIGKTIASMSTCSGGNILIGISDSGKTVGLDTTETENNFRSKVDSAVGKIRPQCYCSCTFEKIEGTTIAVISVPKGPRPVYYFEYIPYFREGTISRPATPEEVENLVVEYYFIQGLSAVRIELKLLKKLISMQMPILELSTEAWKDLIKKAGDPEHEAIVDRVSETYNQILLWNGIGIRLTNEPVLSMNAMEGKIGEFCLERKNQLIHTGRLDSTIAYIEEKLLI